MTGLRDRVPPVALAIIGATLTVGLARAWLGRDVEPTAPWWAYLFPLLLAVALLAIAAAVAIDPHLPVLRRGLAGSALVWLVILGGAFALAANARSLDRTGWALLGIALADGLALAGLALTTRAGNEPTPPLARLGAVIAFAVAILMAAGAAVVGVSIARAVWRAISQGDPIDRLPWGAVIAVVLLPLVAFALASLLSHRAAGGTFFAQAAANRRNSVLLLVTLVGVVAATAEIIAITLTADPIPGLWAAGIAVIVGLGAAAGANRFGSAIILETAGARPADPSRESVLVDVVRELSLAANIPIPRTYVIEDGSQNAFATGRDPEHASVAVTRGLIERLDREELQGVIGHELGHVRNLDTRYALYVAVLVGLVALVTDGFLQLVVEGWRHGAFFWKSDDKSALATLAMGLLVGLFLLIVAALLRVVAPLFSALVQAASSREREFLADATSVEFTRNPRALERALASLASDRDQLDAANRGTQHLWFRNPVREGSDRRAGLLSTHPSLAARIDRLRALQGLDPLDPRAAETPAVET